ncbi:hypothetical protein ABN448_21945 [Delftia acidovorans]|uniref:hypothetical protein n=1 Tax=Delftia acidovorans TaxID=80866 RepID=UPI0032DEBBAD
MEIRLKFDAALWFVYALSSVIVVGALLLAYPNLWGWLGENSSNIASWVQAVGAILTIYFGFKVAKFTIEEGERRHEKREIEATRQRLRKSSFLMVNIYHQIYLWSDNVYVNLDSSNGNWDFFMMGCTNEISRASTLSTEDFPDAIYIMDLTMLRVRLENLLFLFKLGADDGDSVRDGLKAEVQGVCERSKISRDEMLKVFIGTSNEAERAEIAFYTKNRFI